MAVRSVAVGMVFAVACVGLTWANDPVGSGRAALERGEGKQALRHLLPAARKGDAEACYWLGRLYYYDVPGVARNFSTSRRWFERAAQAGHAGAQYKLGGMYFAGRGAPRDLPKAIAWWRKAAVQGQPEALNNLGALIVTGEGVRRDNDLGRALQILAASKGSDTARENLARKEITEKATRMAQSFADSPAALEAALKDLTGNP